ncbi:MAG: TlpA family protein disulfide reductase [Paenibacillus sp.]|nr:TlpA family protein disulfide reductase [Paenibacillus sp.]
MNRRFLKIAALPIVAGVMLASCGESNNGPMLKGHIEGMDPDSEAYIIYSLNGDLQSNAYDKISLDSLGNFEFNPQLPEGTDFMEVEVNIDGINYGAYVEKGATTVMDVNLTDRADGYAAVNFSGDNVDVNTAVNTAAQAYDFMRYFSMDPDDKKTDEEYSALLESENDRVVKALAGISDSSKKEYYTKLYDLQYMGQKMSNLSSSLYEKGYTSFKEILADSAYKAMFDRIDITDPMMVKANLTILWVNANEPYNMNWEHPDVDSMIMNLVFIDENIKEPVNRRCAIASAPFMYLEKTKPSKADAQKYMAEYSMVAAEYPDLVERYQKVADGIVELTEGERMPYYPVLTDTEGNEVKLADLMGKVTYIDIWATWCGPCCREIPYLDKVVERFKDNDKIQFISISVDDDRDAWLKKLAADKPAWPQYLLSGDEKKQFMSAMGIQGIPRFILLDAEGRFIQNDAVRPSSDNIDTVLNDAIK